MKEYAHQELFTDEKEKWLLENDLSHTEND